MIYHSKNGHDVNNCCIDKDFIITISFCLNFIFVFVIAFPNKIGFDKEIATSLAPGCTPPSKYILLTTEVMHSIQ